jgi:serine/threonine protein kinase
MAPDEQLAQRLPLPLAQLYRRAHNAQTAQERHLAAFYLWEAALKLLGCAAIVTYADRGERDPHLAERLQNLARPSLGHWWEFIRLLVPALADSGDGGFRAVREVVLGQSRDDLPHAAGLDAVLCEVLENAAGARSTVRVGELFDRLVRYRNRELGHGAAGQRSNDFHERMGGVLLAGIAELLGQMDVLAGRRMVHVAEVRQLASGAWLVQRYELRGESPRRLESLEVPGADAALLPRPGLVYLAGPGQIPGLLPVTRPGDDASGFAYLAGPGQIPGLLPLHPLLLFAAETDEVLFLNSTRGRAEYLCYTTGRTADRPDLGTEQRAVLARILGRDVGEAEAPAAEAPAPAERQRLGEFELLSELGRGGMGVVYRAWQPSLGRQVALKVLLRTSERVEARYLREFRALARVDHPNLIKLYATGTDGGDSWFVAMELVDGASLADVFHRLSATTVAPAAVTLAVWRQSLQLTREEARRAERPLDGSPMPPEASAAREPHPEQRRGAAGTRDYARHMAELLRQVAEAVHALHEARVLHRDIKPANILTTTDGSRAVLADIGLAQLADEEEGKLTWTRQFVGTLRYASPEMVHDTRRADRRSDVYSLGATLWELLTLRPLYGATEQTPTPDLMQTIQLEEPARVRNYNSAVPRDLEAVVMKCLVKDPAKRYATARELADDLERYLRGEPVQARPATSPERLLRWAQNHSHAALVVGIAAVVIMVLAWFLTVWQANDRETDLGAEQRYVRELEARLQKAGIPLPSRPPTLQPDLHAPAVGFYKLGWVCCGLLAIAAAAALLWRRALHQPTAATTDPAPSQPLTPPRRLRFEPGEAFSSQTVVLHYPAPIALAYRRFTWSGEPKDQLFRLFLTFQATLRYLVTLGLSDLFHCKVRSAGPVEPLPKNQAFDLLRRPTRMTLGQWIQTLRETARVLDRQPHRFIRELPEVCRPGGSLEQDFFRWITDSRNDEFHPKADIPHSPDECRTILKEARPRLERLLQEVQFVRSYPLGFVTPGYAGEDFPALGQYRAHSGMGAWAAFGEGMFVLETRARLPVGHPFVVAPDGGRLLYLWPLLRQQESDRTQRPSLYVFETIAEGSAFLGEIEFAAIDHEHEWRETLHDKADSHDWLWQALRELPAVVSIDPDLNLVERLAHPLLGTLVGETLGHYRLSRPIAKGGFGTVYDAVDTRDHSRVAVKVLEVPDGLRSQDQEQLYHRFRQEFDSLRKAGAGCRHVIRCFERGVTPRGNRYYPWYSMEFAAGGDLTARLLARRAGLDKLSAWDAPSLRSEAAAEFRAVATAVAHLHELGFVHRDIKPGNVLLVEEDAGSVVKLSDFGLIKELQHSHGLTTTGALVGTRGYMAPEQERGVAVAAPADIYALGMLLAELATGHPPEPDLLTPAGSRIEGDKRVDRLPEPLRRLIVRCTDINPSRRPEKARYVLSDFEAIIGSG